MQINIVLMLIPAAILNWSYFLAFHLAENWVTHVVTKFVLEQIFGFQHASQYRSIIFRYKYTYMEEKLENISAARALFERWMEWHPEQQAWNSYINMELRYNQIDRVCDL